MKKGFTLIELLVVVLIICILSAVALPQYTKAVEKSRATEAQTLLGNLVNAELIYQMSQGNFTGDLTVLDLQLPGVGSTSTNTTSTKNFQVTVTTPSSATGTASTFAAEAARLVNNAVATSGDLAYKLVVTIDADGLVSRTCEGAASTCKSIANGAQCATSMTGNKDWCFNKKS